jgi:hypothetical protein
MSLLPLRLLRLLGGKGDRAGEPKEQRKEQADEGSPEYCPRAGRTINDTFREAPQEEIFDA